MQKKQSFDKTERINRAKMSFTSAEVMNWDHRTSFFVEEGLSFHHSPRQAENHVILENYCKRQDT